MIKIRNIHPVTAIKGELRFIIRISALETLKYCRKNPDDFSLDILLTDEFIMRKVNNAYRGKTRSTDVLTFPLGENGKWTADPETNTFMLGDTLISLDDAINQAISYGHTLEREIAFLTVHSLLHHLGFDHETSLEDEKRMFAIQDDVLKSVAHRLKAPTVRDGETT
ncbi:MAG: rRNA maturation RNase YbeY [Ruminococcus sp.]|jgi:probable rRNA maturation factor|nr:rRNA maturation RNase YbeY [Ruminococcus sp.]